MAIEFECPACRGTLRVADDAAGQTVRCGNCMAALRAPAGGAAASPDPRPERESHGEPRRPSRPPKPAGRGVLFWLLVLTVGGGGLSCLCCGGGLLLLQPQWRTHESAAGRFKVDLPADPRTDMEEHLKLQPRENAHAEGTVLIGKLEVYTVYYDDIDPVARVWLTDEALLKRAVEELKSGAKKISDTPATVSGLPARELVVRHGGDGVFWCRVVVSGSRVYVAAAGGPLVTEHENERVRKFLDSFQLTDPKPPAVPKGKKGRRDED